jgi:hypothetical protein
LIERIEGKILNRTGYGWCCCCWYTAGMIDFLLEAIETLEKAKRVNKT